MTQTDVSRVQLRRVNAFQGLMIDAEIWRDAHEYHRSQMRLHQLALHGWGIAHGLEVSLGAEDNTIVVSPGVAVDPSGHFIVVSQPYVHRVDVMKPGPAYLLLQYSEVPTGPMQPANDPSGQPTRIVEAYRIHQRDELPSQPHLELCRLTFDPLAGRVKLPQGTDEPGPNEVDVRFRTPLAAPMGAAVAPPGSPGEPTVPSALPVDSGWTIQPTVTRPGDSPVNGTNGTNGTNGHASPAFSIPGASTVAGATAPITVVVGRHSGEGWDAHSRGLEQLTRELGYANRTVNLDEQPLAQVERADVLYLTGQGRFDLGEAESEALRRVIERGGWIVGDGCASGPRGDAGARDFSKSFSEAVEQIGHRLQAIERGHAAFTGRYLFAVAPAGARASNVIMGDGTVLYCDADYGCAWAGGSAQQPLQRGAIRDATELGANLFTLGKS